MDVIESIRNNFNKGFFGKSMLVEGLPSEYPAWTLKQQDWYGVAIKMDRQIDFSEHFAAARIWTSNDAIIDGQYADLLLLTCSDASLRNEFATICTQFVSTDESGEARKKIVADPVQWWTNWKSLMGNRQGKPEVYSKIGELMVVEQLLQQNYHPRWSGIDNAVHDVELDDRSYEVKSTTNRYGYEVEISSIYQMKKAGEELALVFMRFELSQLGRSLDDVAESVSSLGYPRDQLEMGLDKAGLEKGCFARTEKYRLLEMKVYPVDESFPAITIESFVGGQLPAHITRIKYVADLAGVKSKTSL